MKKRKIAIITGSRADYGHLRQVIKKVHEDKSLRLLLLVTGSHLDSWFGMTVKEIRMDAFPIASIVRISLVSDSAEAVGRAIGAAVTAFTRVYARLKPDVITILGDRFEIFAAAAAAVPLNIPLAHLHGGESTEGVIDEQFRHAITKMSHIHFASSEHHRRRIVQMGEDPERVFCVGSPGIDNLMYGGAIVDRRDLLKMLRVPEGLKIGVVTYHPVTLGCTSNKRDAAELVHALKAFKDVYWVITASNADTGGRSINTYMKKFARQDPDRAGFFHSLGAHMYTSLLKNAAVMVGNSSSGLIEAPSFHLPVVNIGRRQQGRVRASNVIDVTDARRPAIVVAIKNALSPPFILSLRSLKNPYGDGKASDRIVRRLKTMPVGTRLLMKKFYEKKDSYH